MPTTPNLYLWPFHVILTGKQGLALDYRCGKFGDGSFSRFGSIVQADRQTDATKRFTPVTVVGKSN